MITDLEKYTQCGINIDFSANLSEDEQKNITEYGIKLYLKTEEDFGDEIGYNLNDCTLSSKDFLIGNPFNFSGVLNVKKIFDISHLNRIVEIIAKPYIVGSSIDDNIAEKIVIKSVSVDFGYDLSNFSNESLYIYTPEASYNYNAKNNNSRDLYLRWIYNDDGEKRVITYKNSDQKPENALFKWQTLNGTSWVDIVPTENNIFTNKTGELDLFKETEQFRCVVEYSVLDSNTPKRYNSNILTFKNLEDNSYKDILTNLNLLVSNTNYSDIYGSDGKIIDYGLSIIPSSITAKASINLSKINLQDYNINVVWTFPEKKDSMLINAIYDKTDLFQNDAENWDYANSD